MKIKTFNRMLLALSCAAAISVSCDKRSETEQKAPSITISEISAGAEFQQKMLIMPRIC